MMITLNIIPPQQKQELKLKKVFQELNCLVSVLLLFAIIAAIVILVAKSILQNNFFEIVEQNTRLSQTNQKMNRQIQNANQKIKLVEKIQTENIYWPDFFILIDNLTPTGIKFISLKTNPGNIIEIRGRAATRDALMEFKKRIEQSKNIINANLPITNLLAQDNIDFSLTFRISNWPTNR